MTLIEVMISLAIFSIFILSFMSGQGNNLRSSVQLKEDLRLRDLAELILNEQMIQPPQVKVTSGEIKIDPIKSRKFKSFEEDNRYEYAVNTYKLAIPDFDKIVAQDPDEQSAQNKQNQSTQKMIYNKFKKNMEKLVFQIIITVRHKTSGQFFELATWFYQDGVVQLGI